ncbi:hypothetical protein IE53DRAFT_249690 [Violaceomyces palustris]|uniref:Uncharacterized protein n=1 Tax=Violaceomyces palustris TaxID=1673888 RepID=A0ACD0NNR4_9BASI|nr:hypothetical protein IE53DRAFT_249690 [Violaceomyces palustris]
MGSLPWVCPLILSYPFLPTEPRGREGAGPVGRSSPKGGTRSPSPPPLFLKKRTFDRKWRLEIRTDAVVSDHG